MLRKFFGKSENDEELDARIHKLLQEMSGLEILTDDYQNHLTTLERLTELRERNTKAKVSKDTVLLVAGNLLGLILIMAYEQKHVMTTKGLNQLIKPR